MSELTQFVDGRGEPVARIPLAVYLYVVMAGVLLVLAAVPEILLTRRPATAD
jgi:hypothetical protein